MLPHPLTSFEIYKYYQNEPKFNNLIKKDGVYITNLDEWWNLDAENVTYFDSFGVEHIPKEIRNSIWNKNIITSIYRIQAYVQ